MYYYLFPLLEGILDDHELQHIMLLPYAMMLLGSFNTEPVSALRIAEAEKALKRYSTELTELGIPCRFISHQIVLIPQDVSNFQCGVETLSAFPYENFQSFFRRCLRSSNLQVEQIRNRLIEKAKYQLPTTACGTIIENKVQLMIESRKIKAKSKALLKFVQRGERWPKKLVFTQFVLSNKFPNNVCLMKDRSVVVCNDIFLLDRVPYTKPQKFLTLQDAFELPYRSSDFDIYAGSNLSTYMYDFPASNSFTTL